MCSTRIAGSCAGGLISCPSSQRYFDLLVFLIANRERVASKDDLIGTVWNGRIVSDFALTTRVNAARSAIGDSGEEQRLIRTLPRKGFRFVGRVQEEQGPGRTPDGGTSVEPPRYQEIGFPALQKGSHDKKLIGYFQADTGTINQIVHLWKFDDDADRRAHWAAVYANKDFVEGFASKFRPLLMTQEVKLLQAAPWGPHP